MGTRRFVFRRGSATNQALTPRQKIDTVARPGSAGGLSVTDELKGVDKAQRIDVDRLKAPLRYFPDDISAGGEAGHGVIAPANVTGDVDQAALDQWASCRQSQQDQTHPLTQLVIDAIVERDVRNKT
jgi:hypothetical protein